MADAPVTDPTIYRRRLRRELRRAREAAGFAQRDVARAMDWSLSKLLRIETGAVSITTNDLRALLLHYGITDPARVQALVDSARSARQPSPWSQYRDVAPPDFVSFLAYESAASVIRNYEPLLVPGLLQTEEYARTVLTGIRGPDRDIVDRLVDLRMARRELLERESPPDLHFVMDEAVIRRRVGGPTTMRGQLRWIKELERRGQITIRIVPFSAGLYPRLWSPYILMEFAEADADDVLFIENPLGDLLIRDASSEESSGPAPTRYLETFFGLEQFARREDAAAIVDSAIDDLSVEI